MLRLALTALLMTLAAPVRADVIVIVPDFSSGVTQHFGFGDSFGIFPSGSSPINSVVFQVNGLNSNLILSTRGVIAPVVPLLRSDQLNLVHFGIAAQNGPALQPGQNLNSIGYRFDRTETFSATPGVPFFGQVTSFAALFQDGRIYVHQSTQPLEAATRSVSQSGLVARDFALFNPGTLSFQPNTNPDFNRALRLGFGHAQTHDSGMTGSEFVHQVQFTNTSFDFNVSRLPGAIPEPSTWAMMILGFGLIGGAMRARSYSAARSAASINRRSANHSRSALAAQPLQP